VVAADTNPTRQRGHRRLPRWRVGLVLSVRHQPDASARTSQAPSLARRVGVASSSAGTREATGRSSISHHQLSVFTFGPVWRADHQATERRNAVPRQAQVMKGGIALRGGRSHSWIASSPLDNVASVWSSAKRTLEAKPGTRAYFCPVAASITVASS